MSSKRTPLVCIAVLLCAAVLFSFTACFGMKEPPSIAADVNGTKIEEDDVTDFIEGFRKNNPQYENDANWAEFLKSNGYTSETLRSYVIESVFIPKVLIAQQCAKRDIRVSDPDLDAVIEQEKAYYEMRYGDNSWDSVLASFGYDEKTWRENELNRLLEEKLKSEVVEPADPTEAEVLAMANEEASTYNGKDTYYIEFASEQDARSAREETAGAGDTVSLDQFSRLGDAVHAGWNSLPNDRKAMSTDYIQATNSLNAGNVSDPLQIDGKWMLIYCDSSFNVGAGGESVALASIPQDIYEQIVVDAGKAKTDELFDEWLEHLVESSDIEVSPMPDGLSYNISTTYTEE